MLLEQVIYYSKGKLGEVKVWKGGMRGIDSNQSVVTSQRLQEPWPSSSSVG